MDSKVIEIVYIVIALVIIIFRAVFFFMMRTISKQYKNFGIVRKYEIVQRTVEKSVSVKNKKIASIDFKIKAVVKGEETLCSYRTLGTGDYINYIESSPEYADFCVLDSVCVENGKLQNALLVEDIEYIHQEVYRAKSSLISTAAILVIIYEIMLIAQL